jgi:hypothetical protein
MRFFKLLKVYLRRPFSRRRKRSLPVLIGSLIFICVWQVGFVGTSRHPSAQGAYQHNVGGLFHEWRFAYFLHNLGLFPIATTLTPTDDSRAGAERLLSTHPESLRTEWNYALRVGDLGRVWLYWPSVWSGGSIHPDVRPANSSAFVFALCALFVAFWWIRQPILGAILVLLLGSDPFQVFESYHRQNVFCWSITAATLVLALHVPLLGAWPRSRRYLYCVPIVTGIVLATIQTIRPEPVAILASAIACYLTLSRTDWRTKAILSALSISTLMLTSWAWGNYYIHKIAQAEARVVAVGGTPYPGPRYLLNHQTWTAIWEGLGDFDRKYGYQWNDWRAADYARPILHSRYGVEVPNQSKIDRFITGEYWDAKKLYPKITFDNLPHYQEVLRDKVLHDITHDPIWFLKIMMKRVWRTLHLTTPVQLLVGPVALPVPMHGLFALLIIVALVVARNLWLTKLVLFVAPVSALSLCVTSDLGATFYSIYHVVAAAVLLAAIIEGVLWWRKRRR